MHHHILLLVLVSLVCVTAECPAGSFMAGTFCQECAVGTFSYMPNSVMCNPCTAGSFQNATGRTSCVLCPSGTYSSTVGANSSSVCKTCEAGTFSSYSSCTICFEGSYSQSGANYCTGCPAGTFSEAVGANSSASCLSCPIGTYSGSYSTYCTECSMGTYSNTTAADKCTACPAGTFSMEIAANSSSVCETCPAGSFSKEGNSYCEFCYEGTFSESPGTGECTPCPGGTFSSKYGANTSSVCEQCPVGTSSYPGSMMCSPCEQGTFQNSTGSAQCSRCPAGTFSDAIGANSSSVCQTCTAGYYSKEGSSSCYTCHAGTYSDRNGATNCTGCPAGSFSVAIGANSSSSCEQCPLGSFAQNSGSPVCPLCPRGSFAPETGLSSCISCSVGFTTNYTGSNSFDQCIPCWGDGNNSTNNEDDDDNSNVDDDYSTNSFCVVGSPTATPTASGTTSSTASSTGSSSASATVSSSASATPSASAIPTSSSTSTPSSSSTSSFRHKPPVTRSATPSVFSSRSSTATPSASASATATVSWNNNGASSYATLSSSSTSSNSHSPSSTASSSITSMSTRTSSQTASSIATMSSTATSSTSPSPPSCPKGFILNLIQFSCEACPAGFRSSPADGAVNTCTPCPPGYVSEKGQAECKACAAGLFASGPSLCSPCAAGTYSALAGTNCTACDVGTYVNTTGATSCIACDPRALCPAGSIQPGPCLLCGNSEESTAAVLTSISNVTTSKEANEALLTISAVANVFRLTSNESTSLGNNSSSSNSAEAQAAETKFRSAVIAQLENIVNVIASSSTSASQNISDMNSTQFAMLLNDTSIPMTAEVSSALASDLKALTSNPKQVTENSAKSSLSTITTLLALSLPVNVQSGAVDAAEGGGGGGGGGSDANINTVPPLSSQTATDFLSAISNVLSSDAVAALSVTNSSTSSPATNGNGGGGGGGGETIVNSNEQKQQQESDRQKAAAATAILSQISTALNKLSAAVLRSATVGAAPVSIVSAPAGSVFNATSSSVQSFCGPALSMTVQRISTTAANSNSSSNSTSSSSDDAMLSVPLTSPLSPCLANSSSSSSSTSSLSVRRRRLSNVLTTRPSISANSAFLRSATSASSSIDVSFVQNGLSPVPQSLGFATIGGPNATIVDASSPLDTRVVSVTFLTRSGQKVDINGATSPLVLDIPLLNPSVQSESSLLVDNYEKRVFNISCPGGRSSSSALKSIPASMFVPITTTKFTSGPLLTRELSLAVLSTSASGSTTVAVPCDAPIGNRSFVCSPGDSTMSLNSLPYSVTWYCPSLSLVPVCAFWNETLNEWSSEGCVVTQSGGASISCACNHTTNFAARFTALAEQQKVIFTGDKIRENPITLLKQYPYVFILVGGIALFTLLSLLIAYDLDQEAAARYYQSLKNDPEVQFLERIETLKGNVFVLDSVIDKHILLVQDKITRARLEDEASALAKKSGRYYLGHRVVLPDDIFIHKTTWSIPVPDGFLLRLRSGHQLCCKKKVRVAKSVTTKEGQAQLSALGTTIENPMLAVSSSASRNTHIVDGEDSKSAMEPTSPSNAEITIISNNPLSVINSNSANAFSDTSAAHDTLLNRQLTWLQSLTDKYTSDLYVRFEHVFDRFSITASNEVIALSKKAGLSSSIVDVVKESQQEMASQLSDRMKDKEQQSSSKTSASFHLDEVGGSILSRLSSLRGFLFRTWFLQVVFTHPLLSLFTKHDPRNPRYFRTVRLAAVMIGSLWTPILFYSFLHGNKTTTTSQSNKESLGELDLLETIVLAAMSSAVQVPISMVLSILLVGAGKAEFKKRYPFIAAELRRRAKVEDELCKMSKPLLEAELRALLKDETELNLKKPADQVKPQMKEIDDDDDNDDDEKNKVPDELINMIAPVVISSNSNESISNIIIDSSSSSSSSSSSDTMAQDPSSSSISSPSSAVMAVASNDDSHKREKELFAYGWIDAPPDVQKNCPSLLRLCGRHPSQKAAYVANALKAEEERHAILKDKLKVKKKAAIISKANKRSAQAQKSVTPREEQTTFIASNAAVSAVGTALVVGSDGDDHHHHDDNENDDNTHHSQEDTLDDNDDNVDGDDQNNETVDDMLDGDFSLTDIFAFFMSVITIVSSFCCARGSSAVNQTVMSMASKRDVRASNSSITADTKRGGGSTTARRGAKEKDSIASIYKLASENSSKIVVSNLPMTVQTFSALSLFVVIVSFWLFYIAQFGFNHSAETTLSIVFVWLFNQAFSFFVVEPMLTGVNVILTFVVLPALLPSILWIPNVGSAVAGKVACDLANKDGRSVLSGRMENLTLVRAAGAASMLSPEASVVAYGLGAVLSATMSRIGGESLLQQRNRRAAGSDSDHTNNDAFSALTETQRNDLIVRRYVLAQLNAAEKAQRRKNNLAKRLVISVSASRTLKDRVVGRETKNRRRNENTNNPRVVVQNNEDESKKQLSICGICGEFERRDDDVNDENNNVDYCMCSNGSSSSRSNDDDDIDVVDNDINRQRMDNPIIRSQCTICGEDEKLFENEEGDFCTCNVEL